MLAAVQVPWTHTLQCSLVNNLSPAQACHTPPPGTSTAACTRTQPASPLPYTASTKGCFHCDLHALESLAPSPCTPAQLPARGRCMPSRALPHHLARLRSCQHAAAPACTPHRPPRPGTTLHARSATPLVSRPAAIPHTQWPARAPTSCTPARSPCTAAARGVAEMTLALHAKRAGCLRRWPWAGLPRHR